jgi:hypothetical protein
MRQQAEKVQGFGVAWLVTENAPVGGLRFLEAAALVQFDRGCQ